MAKDFLLLFSLISVHLTQVYSKKNQGIPYVSTGFKGMNFHLLAKESQST